MVISEAAKTRKFRASADPVTTPFCRVTDDATVRFSRPYERVELTDAGPEPERVELDLSQVVPIDDTLPFALDDVPSFATTRASEPYALIEVALSVPAVAEPLITPEPEAAPRTNITVVLVVILVMLCAFACGMGAVLAVSS